ncbi:MAG: hypothetical protein QF470_03950 [Methylococcales bacterium]|jgi:hypothetical protein|nr:hypothetical protein [Methylococcales bacterium]
MTINHIKRISNEAEQEIVMRIVEELLTDLITKPVKKSVPPRQVFSVNQIIQLCDAVFQEGL